MSNCEKTHNFKKDFSRTGRFVLKIVNKLESKETVTQGKFLWLDKKGYFSLDLSNFLGLTIIRIKCIENANSGSIKLESIVPFSESVNYISEYLTQNPVPMIAIKNWVKNNIEISNNLLNSKSDSIQYFLPDASKNKWSISSFTRNNINSLYIENSDNNIAFSLKIILDNQ
ncbi:MAG: hypothetical protein IR526_00275 [Bordetella sp.]|nr:MAG: hypothetical protein IR526_00275 [Bordetella sp.]